MSAFYAFSDEAGAYKEMPSEKFIQKHPYYVRSTVLISVEEYAQYQKSVHKLYDGLLKGLNGEIKWTDIWALGKSGIVVKKKHKGGAEWHLNEDEIKKYFSRIFSTAKASKSLRIILTFTKNMSSNSREKYQMLQYHMQDALQRIDNELKGAGGFATYIADELDNKTANKLKDACHSLLREGDKIKPKYTTLYHSIFFEKSDYSAGVQLADYVAGAFYSFLRSLDDAERKHGIAHYVLKNFVIGKLRCSSFPSKEIMGYGIIEVEKNGVLRDKIRTALDKLR